MSTDVAVLGVGMHPWGKWGRDFTEYGVVAARARTPPARRCPATAAASPNGRTRAQGARGKSLRALRAPDGELAFLDRPAPRRRRRRLAEQNRHAALAGEVPGSGDRIPLPDGAPLRTRPAWTAAC